LEIYLDSDLAAEVDDAMKINKGSFKYLILPIPSSLVPAG
jgi:hypothetical protein